MQLKTKIKVVVNENSVKLPFGIVHTIHLMLNSTI